MTHELPRNLFMHSLRPVTHDPVKEFSNTFEMFIIQFRQQEGGIQIHMYAVLSDRITPQHMNAGCGKSQIVPFQCGRKLTFKKTMIRLSTNNKDWGF